MMKKRILSVLTVAVLLLLVLLPLSVAGAGGTYWDGNPNANLYTDVYNPTHYGIVICRQMHVRDTPSTSGKSYGQIKNGQPVKILGVSDDNNFYILDLESCGFQGVTPGSYGYAKSTLIKMDPQFIATTRLTKTYATPWSRDLKNGEQSGRFFLVLAEHSNWYAVQLMDTTPGTAFIRSGDVGQYSRSIGNTYVVTWDTNIYAEQDWRSLGTAKRFTTCELMSSYLGSGDSISNEYSLVLFNPGEKNEFTAWILNQYIAPMIN